MDKILREIKKLRGNKATYFGKLKIGDMFCFHEIPVLKKKLSAYKRKISSASCCYVQEEKSIEDVSEDMIVFQIKEA